MLKILRKFNSHEISKLILLHIEKFIDSEIYSLSKVQLGIEIMLINISKLSILFITSYIFNIFFETFLVLISFGVIRKTGGGIHAKTSLRCTIFSVSGLVGGTLLALNLTMSSGLFLLGLLTFNLSIFKYAPRDTDKNPIKDCKKRLKLKYITLRNLNLLIVISLFFNNSIQSFIFMGLFLAIVTIIPINIPIKNKVLRRIY